MHRKFLLAAFLFYTNLLFSQANQENLLIVDCMPHFPGGDPGFIAFIKQHTTYPDSALIHRIEGKVIVAFDVDTNGTVKNPVIKRGINKYLDEEALRVLRLLPGFEPCKQKVTMVFPFNFKLPQ